MLDRPSASSLEIVELLTGRDHVFILDLIFEMERYQSIGHIDIKTLRNFIRKRANRILTIVWINHVEAPYLHDGKFEQFGADGLAFILRLRQPKLAGFEQFRIKIENLTFKHPIRDRMLEVLAVMTPFVDLVNQMDKLKDGADKTN